MKPVVYLIGAGPGDPDLLTLRGAEALGRCDVVLYDGLSNQALLSHAPAAEHICVGKHGQSRIWKQQEIIDEMLRHVGRGNTVARLKGGDPAVFARTAEEIDALSAADIPFEVVPGITAALAAGSYAGIPITHRKLASAVALVTGHEEPGKAESAIDWRALADFPGTLVIYMGVTTAKVWTNQLIANGKDPATPTALVRRCSHPDQETIRCRLDQAAERLTPASRFRPPVIAIIGEVATLGEDDPPARPLRGQSILVTRPADQADAMTRQIRSLGGCPIAAPAIAIEPLEDFAPLDQAIADVPDYDAVSFVSVNGVDQFFDRLDALGGDARTLAGIRVGAVGRKTASALQARGIRADLIPEDFRAGSLADLLVGLGDVRRVLIVRASRGSDELPRRLQEAGKQVSEVVAYRNTDVTEADSAVAKMLSGGQIDWVTVTSSATAKNLHRLYGDALRNSRLAAISPTTAETLTDLGLTVDAVADPFTTESLLNEIAKQT